MNKPQIYSFHVAKPVFITRSTRMLFVLVPLYHAAKEKGKRSWACNLAGVLEGR